MPVTKCPYHNRHSEQQLADRALAQVRDIEDLVSLSTSTTGTTTDTTSACPYYASRIALTNANVICLPYNMLLSSDMREALGIDLTGRRNAFNPIFLLGFIKFILLSFGFYSFILLFYGFYKDFTVMLWVLLYFMIYFLLFTYLLACF